MNYFYVQVWDDIRGIQIEITQFLPFLFHKDNLFLICLKIFSARSQVCCQFIIVLHSVKKSLGVLQ